VLAAAKAEVIQDLLAVMATLVLVEVAVRQLFQEYSTQVVLPLWLAAPQEAEVIQDLLVVVVVDLAQRQLMPMVLLALEATVAQLYLAILMVFQLCIVLVAVVPPIKYLVQVKEEVA
jgi:hypothetical protein